MRKRGSSAIGMLAGTEAAVVLAAELHALETTHVGRPPSQPTAVDVTGSHD